MRHAHLSEDKSTHGEPEAESEATKDNYLLQLTLMERNGDEGLEDNLLSTWLIIPLLSSPSHTSASSLLGILSYVKILLQARQSRVKGHGVKSDRRLCCFTSLVCNQHHI
ncbi:unnamed protein product [Arctogadus glacialis]